MATKQPWQDDYWLLLMQQYLRKPTGIKPTYDREMVNLSIELHIPPQVLHERLGDIAQLRTPRIERIWQEYGKNPRRLSRAVKLMRRQTDAPDDGIHLGRRLLRGYRRAGDFRTRLRSA